MSDKTMIKDANAQLQDWMNKGIPPEQQKASVEGWLKNSQPFLMVWADEIGRLEGLSEKTEALNRFFKDAVGKLTAEDRAGFKDALCDALKIKSTQWNDRLRAMSEAAKNGDDEDEMPEIETLGGWYADDASNNSGYLIDIIYDKNKKKILLAYAHIKDMEKGEREVGVADHLIIGKYKYVPPVHDDVIMDGVVKLASGLGPLMSSRDLINKNARYYEKYFYLEEKSRYKFCGAYSLFSWVYDSFEALNFLRARGGSGSGKSDLMYLVGLTSYRFAVTLSTSSSASYRGLAKVYKSSVMIDEADNLMKKDDGTMEAFLKGRSMRRYANSLNMMETMTPNGKVFVPSTTNVYGITFITMYHSFSDPGIENRCITFDLSQIDTLTLDKEGMEPGYYPPELEEDAEEIRNLCLAWRLHTWRPKIELTAEQRKSVKLADPMVSPRVNQVLRPMKVLAVLQQDNDLLEELMMTGRANYEDEMTKRAGSFEAIILRAVIAADTREGYADKVRTGKLGKMGTVRHILYKDLAVIANEVLDAENLADGVTDDKKKSGVKTRTIGEICRETFRMPVARTGDGWAVVLDRERIDIGKLRFGLDREEKAEDEEKADEGDILRARAIAAVEGFKAGLQAQMTMDDGPTAAHFNESTGEWEF